MNPEPCFGARADARPFAFVFRWGRATDQRLHTPMPYNPSDILIRRWGGLGRIHEVIFAAAFFVCSSLVSAQDWVPSTATSNYWLSLACSADGNRLLAASRQYGAAVGSVYRSTNSGATWEATGAPSQDWTSVSCSSDAMKVVAVSGNVYQSQDFGNTWTVATNSGVHGYRATSSADGNSLVVVSHDVAFSGAIYFSTNSGASWTQSVSPDSYAPWMALASSADGKTLLAAGWAGYQGVYGQVSVSTNAGVTWRKTNLSDGIGWNCVAASADGTRLVAAGVSGYQWEPWIYFSTDRGISWQQAASPLLRWSGLTSSGEGIKLAALGGDGNLTVYGSDDGASTWSWAGAPSTNWTCIAGSADGAVLFAAAVDPVSGLGTIYRHQATPAPVLHLVSSEADHIVSWTVPSQSFGLQQSPSLIKAEWTAVPGSPVLNYTNLQYEVKEPKQNGSMFYRLISL